MRAITEDSVIQNVEKPLWHNRLEQFKQQLVVWWKRAQERKQLAQMSQAQWKDIGVTMSDAKQEINKPFWKR